VNVQINGGCFHGTGFVKISSYRNVEFTFLMYSLQLDLVFFLGKVANDLIENAAVAPKGENTVHAVVSVNIVLLSHLASLEAKCNAAHLDECKF